LYKSRRLAGAREQGPKELQRVAFEQQQNTRIERTVDSGAARLLVKDDVGGTESHTQVAEPFAEDGEKAGQDTDGKACAIVAANNTIESVFPGTRGVSRANKDKRQVPVRMMTIQGWRASDKRASTPSKPCFVNMSRCLLLSLAYSRCQSIEEKLLHRGRHNGTKASG
jgi:hypothetical protein